MTKVYEFKKWENTRGEYVAAMSPATREAIANYRGVLDESTGIEVDESELNDEGSLRRPTSTEGEPMNSYEATFGHTLCHVDVETRTSYSGGPVVCRDPVRPR